MRYYLDTNIIYNLRHLQEQVVKNSYTSFLAILEIVAGIDERSYFRRRAALKSVVDSRLVVDWHTPDMIIFDSFGAYGEFSMSDSRVNKLKDTMLRCVSIDSYLDFLNVQVNNISAVEYFRNIDNDITKKFTCTFPELIPSIKKSALVHTITSGDISIDVDFTEAVKADFVNDSQHAMLVKNLATSCQYIIGNSGALDKPECRFADVINSYNGGANFFICAWLAYELKNIGVGNLPGRNDFQDILHFLYLRNHLDRKIVSDDGIYIKLAPEYCSTLHALIDDR